MHSLSPASSHCATLGCSLCVRSWPRCGKCPTSSRTQQVRSLLDVLIHGHEQPRFTAHYTAPPVCTKLAICTRIQSLIHRSTSRASSTSRITRSSGALFPSPKSSPRIFSTVSFLLCTFLEPQVLNLGVLCFAQARSASYGQCCTGVNVQPNRNDYTQVFGKRLNSHRLCCCTVGRPNGDFSLCGPIPC